MPGREDVGVDNERVEVFQEHFGEVFNGITFW